MFYFYGEVNWGSAIMLWFYRVEGGPYFSEYEYIIGGSGTRDKFPSPHPAGKMAVPPQPEQCLLTPAFNISLYGMTSMQSEVNFLLIFEGPMT